MSENAIPRQLASNLVHGQVRRITWFLEALRMKRAELVPAAGVCW